MYLRLKDHSEINSQKQDIIAAYKCPECRFTIGMQHTQKNTLLQCKTNWGGGGRGSRERDSMVSSWLVTPRKRIKKQVLKEVQQIEASNSNNTQTPARILPPKAQQIYFRGLILPPLDWKTSLLKTGSMWNKIINKGNSFHWIPFPRVPLTSTLSRFVPFRFFFQAATTMYQPLC